MENNLKQKSMNQVIEHVYSVLRELSSKCEVDFWQMRMKLNVWQYAVAYDSVLRHVADGAKVLDWGAGNGHFTIFLLECGFNVTSFSLCEEKIYPALKQHYGDRFQYVVAGDAVTHLPFDDDSFDAVCSVGVLEHVRETGSEEVNSLKDIRRILKPGGEFFCYHFPNVYSYIEVLGKFVWKALGRNDMNHLYRFHRSEINAICEGAEMKLLETKRYNFIPRTFFFSKMPTSIGNSAPVVFAFNSLDKLGNAVLGLFSQNHYFRCKK
jgi:SAM-dependent methyltransferase